MQEIDDSGWSDVGTMICSQCITEEYLVEEITKTATSHHCDYCNTSSIRQVSSTPIENVLKLIVDGLRHEYDDPINEMSWDQEYVGWTTDTWDLLDDLEITSTQAAHTALADAITTSKWCQKNPYAASPSQALIWGWSEFCEFVKHRRRFTFLTEDTATRHGAGELPMHAIPAVVAGSVRVCGLITTLPRDSEWWRLRRHPADESYSLAADIGPAPDTVARDSRMTPKGMGAFYGASSQACAVAEVAGYAEETDHGSVAMFRTKDSLRVVDLTSIPPVPSLFDPGARDLRAPIQFLHAFVKDATKSLSSADQQALDYLPTQVISETFRYELQVDGILWNSSRLQNETSCVLFIPSTEVADPGTQTSSTRLVMDPKSVTRIKSPLAP